MKPAQPTPSPETEKLGKRIDYEDIGTRLLEYQKGEYPRIEFEQVQSILDDNYYKSIESINFDSIPSETIAKIIEESTIIVNTSYGTLKFDIQRAEHIKRFVHEQEQERLREQQERELQERLREQQEQERLREQQEREQQKFYSTFLEVAGNDVDVDLLGGKRKGKSTKRKRNNKKKTNKKRKRNNKKKTNKRRNNKSKSKYLSN